MTLLKLNLEKETPSPVRLSFWPFVDLCVIALFFFLFGSKFIVAPGVVINLPRLDRTEVAIANEYDVLTVSEVEGEEMVIFRGMALNMEIFRKQLALESNRREGYTLLVRADEGVSLRTLASLSEIAAEAGYDRIQLAAEGKREGAEGLSEF